MRKQKKAISVQHAAAFVLKFAVLALVGFGVSGLLVTIFLNKRIGPTYLESVSTLSQIQAQLPHILIITALVQALALCMIAALFALFWSHRIAGPLVRFRRLLKDIEQGKIFKGQIAFRSSDQLHGLAQAYSELMLSHRETCAKALALLVQAQKALDECQALEKQGKGNAAEFDRKLKDLKMHYLLIKELTIAEQSDR